MASNIAKKLPRYKLIVDKYQVYEEAGVKEYWIVIPVEKAFLQYILVEGQYTGIRTGPGGTVRAIALGMVH
jgi:Uma2 family endonuclease